MGDAGVAIVGAALVLAVCIGFGVWMDSATCDAQTRGMHVQHRWGMLSGCMVQDPNAGWIPLSNYRVID